MLDVCCGTGLMTAELIARGIDVVGIDASAPMLARARVLLGPDVVLEQVALPDLPIRRTFDAVVSTLDGLNYLTLAEFRASLAAFATVLRPGGWLVFDLHGEATLAFLTEHALITGETDRGDFVLRSSVEPVTRACTTTIELTAPDPAESFTETHVQYVHGNDDVRDALRDAGFTDVAATVEYTAEPAEADTLRVTWVARRA